MCAKWPKRIILGAGKTGHQLQALAVLEEDRFSPQNPHDSSQHSGTPVLGDPMSSSALSEHYTYKEEAKTHMHKIKINQNSS